MEIDALVTEGAGSGFILTRVLLGDPEPDEVLVRIEAVGVCHTDVGVAAGYLTEFSFPAVLGHEGAGVVEAVGRNVRQVQVGDHVVLTGPRCQTCRYCQDGRPAYCQRADELVFAGRRADGTTALSSTAQEPTTIGSHFFGQSSFATYAVAAGAGVVAIDRAMPFDLAAPLACGVVTGWGTVTNHLRVRPDDRVVVIGFGGVGSAATAAALACGAHVFVVEPLAGKAAVAESIGATLIDGSNERTVVSDVKDVTHGGADHVVCTVGALDVVERAVAMAGRNGAIALVGGSPPGGRISVDPNDLLFAGKRIAGVRMGEMVARRDIPNLVSAWAEGRLPLERFVTSFDLTAIDEALAATARGEVIKAVLRPSHSSTETASHRRTPS
jgi:aryl-alcohol dehydrogenase